MTDKTDDINELIGVLEDGREFYSEASAKVSDPDLKALFNQMGAAKKDIAADLKTIVQFKGEEPADGSFAGSVRQLYARVRVALSSEEDVQYVEQLEEFEDKILAKFEKQAKEAESLEVRAIAAKHLPEVKLQHDQMRAVQKALR